MAKSKKVTFNMVATDIIDQVEKSITYKGKNHEFSFPVKVTLSMKEALMFVNDVSGMCIDLKTGTYRPELLDFAFKMFTLIYYAGLSVPSNPEKAYDVVYRTDIYIRLEDEINRSQHDELYHSIVDRVEYMKNMLVSSQTSLLNDLIQKMDNIIDEGNKTMNTLSSEEFKEQINNALRFTDNIDNHANDVEEESVSENNIIILDR